MQITVIPTTDRTEVMMKTERMVSPRETTISSEEAARRLGVSRSYLDKARAAGMGPVAYRFGKKVVFRVLDIEAYAAAHRVEPAASTEGGRA